MYTWLSGLSNIYIYIYILVIDPCVVKFYKKIYKINV